MKDLHKLRKEIDVINGELISLLEKRFDITKKMMGLKDKEGIPRLDSKRENEITIKLQKETTLSKEFIEKFMKLIFEEAKNA